MNLIDQLNQRAADIEARYSTDTARLAELRAKVPPASSLSSAVAAYLAGGEAPDLLAIARDEAAQRRALDAIAAAQAGIDEHRSREMQTLTSERQVIEREQRGLRDELSRTRQAISGRNTPRWCVDDHLRAAAAIGDDELKEAAAWCQKHGVRHLADEWLAQRAV